MRYLNMSEPYSNFQTFKKHTSIKEIISNDNTNNNNKNTIKKTWTLTQTTILPCLWTSSITIIIAKRKYIYNYNNNY